jgi:hypothetical protein
MVVAKKVLFTDHTTAMNFSGGMFLKFDPVTVSVRSELPATALVGEIELIEGGPNVVVPMLKLSEFDFARGMPPIGSPVSTNTWAVPAFFNNAAGTIAES